jgi:hypothetical protein
VKPATFESKEIWVAQALDRVYAAIASGTPDSRGAPATLQAATESTSPANTPLQRLAGIFGLTPFERDVLLLCLGTELESRFGQACAAAQGEPKMSWPTFALALTSLPEAHWSALARNRPLRYWRLIEMARGESLVNNPLRLDERILHYLIGLPCIDEHVEAVVRPLPVSNSTLTPSQLQSVEAVARLWSGSVIDPGQQKPVLLIGHRSSDRQLVMNEACRAVGLHPCVLRAADFPINPTEREQLARFCNREALLNDWAFYIQLGEMDAPDAGRSLVTFISHIRVPVAIEAHEGMALDQFDGLRICIPGLDYGQRRALWVESLGDFATQMNGHLDRIVEGFDFDSPTIRFAGALVRDAAGADDTEPGRLAWQVCRTHARRFLGGLAENIQPRSRWNDLVLPEQQNEILRQIINHVRHRSTVHREWGFSERYGRGLGVTALFAGGSGTGKTMAGEIISVELERDLYQVDLASVVSKYIGETEKNLRRIFDAADESASVLLFNEADALFGKRSEIRDSHDRYANLEISYLLQRMESYRGVAILTTNMKHALDAAFLRRLRFIVQFPFPDATQRQAIWQRIFPADAPLGQLDFTRLAQLNVSGGIIRNIAMHAAFLAAEEASAIGMDQILRAARIEYAKIEKPLTGSEIGGWS